VEPNESEEVVNAPRETPSIEKPYCWQSKSALRTIRASYGNDTRLLPYLMSTYLGLTEIASDEGRPVFTKSIQEILVKTGGSYRKLTEVLGMLERLSILHIQHNFVDRDAGKGKAPSTYTLLTLRHGVPKGLGTVQTHPVPILIKNAYAKNFKEKEKEKELGIGQKYGVA
jgi:hypothetical protein